MNKSDFIIVYKGKFVGLTTQSGEEVLPCDYDKIPDYDDDGYIRFIKDGVYGTVNLKGEVCIPLSKQLTHLGVFHKGTARAQRNNCWGLVDTQGEEVTGFVYESMNAHYKNGYKVVTMEGVKGWLTEDGKFTAFSKQSKPKPLYSYIATYRNHVAPAIAQNGKWVFIDENKQRINDIEYWSMDHVLRQGIYHVAKGPNAYGIANFEGIPLINEWYDHPCKFDQGFAVCDIKRQDEEGNDIILDDGQPAYYYGVLNLEGKYLFPPVYSSLHWNNYHEKDCWFAEDEEWAYLLFPDGKRRTYRKSEISYDGILECIPESALDHYIKGETANLEDKPQLISAYYYKLFDDQIFKRRLSPWMGGWFKPLLFYYRDTDAEIDVAKLYKPGKFIRTDSDLLVSQKLMKPVHKIRFLIAACELYLTYPESTTREERGKNHSRFMIPAYSHFLVIDVQKIAGVTQVVLLHIPHGAMMLAKRFKLRSSLFKPVDEDGNQLKKAALLDLNKKYNECVHGHSLNETWCQAMYQPVGCDSQFKLNPLIMQTYVTWEGFSEDNYYKLFSLGDRDKEWEESLFYHVQPNAIKILKGDITKQVGNLMINPVRSDKDGKDVFEKYFTECADKELVAQCMNELSAEPGSTLLTKSYNLPYKSIVHVRMPDSSLDLSAAADIIKQMIDEVFKLTEKQKFNSILMPGSLYADDRTMKIIVEVMLRHLFKKKYKGDVDIYSEEDEILTSCKSYLDSLSIENILQG